MPPSYISTSDHLGITNNQQHLFEVAREEIFAVSDLHIDRPADVSRGTGFHGHTAHGFFVTLESVHRFVSAGDMFQRAPDSASLHKPNVHNPDRGQPAWERYRHDPGRFIEHGIIAKYPSCGVYLCDSNHGGADDPYFARMQSTLSSKYKNFSSGEFFQSGNLLIGHFHQYIKYVHEGSRGRCYFEIHKRPIVKNGAYSAVKMKGKSETLYKKLATAICKIDIVQALAVAQCEAAQNRFATSSARKQKPVTVHIYIGLGHLHRGFRVEREMKLREYPNVIVKAHVTAYGSTLWKRGCWATRYKMENGTVIGEEPVNLRAVSLNADQQPKKRTATRHRLKPAVRVA